MFKWLKGSSHPKEVQEYRATIDMKLRMNCALAAEDQNAFVRFSEFIDDLKRELTQRKQYSHELTSEFLWRL